MLNQLEFPFVLFEQPWLGITDCWDMAINHLQKRLTSRYSSSVDRYNYSTIRTVLCWVPTYNWAARCHDDFYNSISTPLVCRHVINPIPIVELHDRRWIGFTYGTEEYDRIRAISCGRRADLLLYDNRSLTNEVRNCIFPCVLC